MDPERLDRALAAVCKADAVTRPEKALAFLSHVRPFTEGLAGLQILFERAPRFDACGGFVGMPWNDPGRLRPRLWAGSFAADPPFPWWEVMSTLRVLAVATGRAAHEELDQEAARRFLERILALNIDKLLESSGEASRHARVRFHAEAVAVLRFVLERLPRANFLRDVAAEVDAIMAQRPVWTHHVRATLRLVAAAPGADEAALPTLERYVAAVLGPSPMSIRFRDPEEYEAVVLAPDAAIEEEVEAMARSLRETGLASRQHAVLLRAVRKEPRLLAAALGLDEQGTAVLVQNPEAVQELVERTIHPGTAQTAYGLSRFLERGLLARSEVEAGLQRLGGVQLTPETELVLQGSADADPRVSGVEVLLGGAVRVLGCPLGVGQGNNPTCQAARAISLWAQYRPGYLLELLAMAAQEGSVAMSFEGQTLDSALLAGGLAPRLDPDLDPVSLVLVPHLDRLYDEMMRRGAFRAEDAHKWVNPALYGRIVPPGFSSCFDPVTYAVRDHAGFVRRFAATFHPEYNAGGGPLFATPIGITVTDNRGRLLGLHAVTLQRVAPDAQGVVRVYFYNPNNEGRQDWGLGAVVSVRGNGELEGESSLPFDLLASRVYAFHHPVVVPGDEERVPDALVERVSGLARASWGRSYPWPVEGSLSG